VTSVVGCGVSSRGEGAWYLCSEGTCGSHSILAVRIMDFGALGWQLLQASDLCVGGLGNVRGRVSQHCVPRFHDTCPLRTCSSAHHVSPAGLL
jgi:hypothetical protein